MNPSLKYCAAALSMVVLVTIALWSFLDPAGRLGVVIAGMIAVPVQATAFAALRRFRGRTNGFLAAWAGGTAVRMAVVALAAFFAVRSGTDAAVPMLLALVGFLFAMLLIEPMYFGREPSEVREA